ncbi:MAG: 4Fe-4S dicluster domain-containing protein [Nitrospinales bacterium]
MIIEREHFHELFDALKKRGYRVVGPTLGEGAIVYEELSSISDLPAGWTDEQDGATYRLKRRGDEALFGYVVGPHSWKKFLFPPETRLWKARRKDGGVEFLENEEETPKFAFIGVRACELKAMAIQDKVFLQGEHVDPEYQVRRENAFIVAVNCGQAGGTCFCVSMNSGPKVESGFDLSLTEVIGWGKHYFVVESGTNRGKEVLEEVTHRPATKQNHQTADRIIEKTKTQMGRKMDTEGIKDLLYNNFDHARWEDVATRCLSCANCTMVCPTCFCSTVEDVTDLTGENAERWRKWDSCFTMDFSYIHDIHVRASTKSRYRQWITHKLASWIDQFDSSGCVGCGRCITWCPVAIDITEEVRAIRDNPGNGSKASNKGENP